MATIGIFDSGVGGLSVFREIYKVLPQEGYMYFSDNAHCPYGEKSREYVTARAKAITDFMLEGGADLIVVACNTATAAAIATLREDYSVSFVGMEPALKPAVTRTQTGVVGILATAGTLGGGKYHDAKEKFARGVEVVEHVGRGFVELVERGVLDGSEAEAVVAESVDPIVKAGADVIVLGCTHYPFLKPVISRIAGPSVCIIDPAPAIARRVSRLILEEGIKGGHEGFSGFPAPHEGFACNVLSSGLGNVSLACSGSTYALERTWSTLFC